MTTDAGRKRHAENARIRDSGHRGILGFMAIDGSACRAGALPRRVKGLLGLTAALVLRSDEAVESHLERCAKEKV